MSIYVYIATSLDGYIADGNGGLEWLNDIPNPEHSDFGYADFISRIDAIVMGRNTFEKVQTFGFWPYEKPVFVLSSSLKKPPSGLAEKVEIVNSEVPGLVNRLKEDGFINLYIDGGLVIQSFLIEDLIDEIIITTLPIILGGGIPLFGQIASPLKFVHKKTEVLLGTLVKSYYSRQK